MTTVGVVIPWHGEDPDREAAIGHVIDQLHHAHHRRGWLKLAAGLTTDTAPEFIKAGCVHWGVAALDTIRPLDVVIVHDADVLVDARQLATAVHAVVSGAYRWAIPHQQVWRLNRAATGRLYDGDLAVDDVTRRDCAERPYPGIVGGGVTVVARSVWDATPMDPRFVGWGGEDISWGYALATLHGRPWRSRAPLIHLWHEPAERRTRSRGSRENDELRARYARAATRPELMAPLAAEARAALPGE